MENISKESFNRIISLGVKLAAERDMNRLLDTILTEAMAITNCDAGTLYLLKDNHLHFTILRNHTLDVFQGGEGDKVDLPPLELHETNVAAYVTIHRRMENIPDVYNSDKFDFSGPCRYDQLTGYRTRSMLVIPLLNNRDEIVGTLQLINAMDEEGQFIPFDPGFEEIFRSVSSLAAIAVTNMRFAEENKTLFQSMIEVLAAAIDERSNYNANHTRQVAELTLGFVDFLNQKHEEGFTDIHFSTEAKEQVVMAAWLHDVGKIITPLEIMDKSTRLGNRVDLVELRFETILTAERIRYLDGEISKEEYETLATEIMAAKELCLKANTGAPTSDDELVLIKSYGERVCELPSGLMINWLTDDEIECLALNYGTLTANERKIMEQHVNITERLLKKIKFSSQYINVPLYATGHHEKLNGRGYPYGKAATDLPLGTRILTILDVFEALTAKDRPYKKPMPLTMAFEIIDKMVAAGEIDGELVGWLKQWKGTE